MRAIRGHARVQGRAHTGAWARAIRGRVRGQGRDTRTQPRGAQGPARARGAGRERTRADLSLFGQRAAGWAGRVYPIDSPAGSPYIRATLKA